MLKKIVLFSLALFITSCGSDSPTNSDDDTFDIGITENKEWVYEPQFNTREGSRKLVAIKSTAPDGTKCFKMYHMGTDGSVETAEEKNDFNYFNVNNSEVFIFRESFESIFYKSSNGSFWEKLISLNEDKWMIYEENKDTTYSSGYTDSIFVNISGEVIDRTKIEFEGKLRESIATRITTIIEITSKNPRIPNNDISKLKIEEYIFMDGIGIYEIGGTGGREVTRGDTLFMDTPNIRLVDYKEN